MAVEPGEVRRGDPGTDREALPQGAAAEANAALPADADIAAPETVVEESGHGPEDPTPPQGVEWHDGSDPGMGTYKDEEEQFLLGGSDRPNESINAYRPGKQTPPPKEVEDIMPHLLEAAADPESPEAVRRLVRLLEYHKNGR